MKTSVLACGIDLIDLQPWSRILESGGELFYERNFTAQERAWCAGNAPRLAARFAAKEAVAKALGTGLRDGVDTKDIEVVNAEDGQPSLRLCGQAAKRAESMHLSIWRLSLTYGEHQVIAFVVAGSDAALKVCFRVTIDPPCAEALPTPVLKGEDHGTADEGTRA